MSRQILTVVSLALVLATSGLPQPLWAKEKVYTHSLNGVPKNLDPVQVESYYSSLIVASIYDTLYTYKYLARPYELKPQLAEAMPEVSKDGKTYTIKIQKGVFFADDPAFKQGKGREVTAQDFIYSIKRHMDPKNRSTSASNFENIAGLLAYKKTLDDAKPITGLQALDRYTIQIKLVRADPRFVHQLASVPAAIVAHEAVSRYGRELAIRPVGSGPFKLEAFDATEAVLVRNPQYRKEVFQLEKEGYNPQEHKRFGLAALDGQTLPRLDRMVIKFMKQSTSRWNSFTKGDEIQYATVPPDQAGQVMASLNPPRLKPAYAEKYLFKAEPELGLVFSTFNMANPEIGHHPDPVRDEKNRALRCAIRKGFDWPGRIQRFYFGLGEAYGGAIPPGMPGYSPLPLDSVKYDPKQAKKILQEAGWNAANLPTIVYGGASSVKVRQMFEQFRGWMKRIGYPRHKIKFKTASTFGDYIKAVNEGDYDYYGMGWAPSIPDPLQLMERYSSRHLAPGSNKAQFKHAGFDQLFDKAEFMPDGPERTAAFKAMNEILAHECVAIESFSRMTLHVWHKNVRMDYTGNMLRHLFKFIDVEPHPLSH